MTLTGGLQSKVLNKFNVRLYQCGYLKGRICKTATLQLQGGSNMTGTDLYVNKPHCAAAVRP